MISTSTEYMKAMYIVRKQRPISVTLITNRSLYQLANKILHSNVTNTIAIGKNT